jgi:hypothetical protein
MGCPNLEGWLPIRLYWHGSEPWVDWCYLGAQTFIDPMFDLTVHYALQLPFNTLFRHQTPLETLAEWQVRSPGLKPSGFIYHVSHCGSTLVSRLLAAVPGNLVLSEPRPLDLLARTHQRASEVSIDRRAAWLEWMVSALGQPRTGKERCYFIKLDSRTTFQLPLMRRAFPNVPWILQYRNPVEVLVACLRDPDSTTTPGVVGENYANIPPDEACAMPVEEYAARVIARFFETAAEFYDGSGMLVDYSQLPEAIWGEIARHFGLALSAEDIAEMQEETSFHSKKPGERFASDTASKRREAGEQIGRLAEEWIMPHYRKLEELRRAKAAV